MKISISFDKNEVSALQSGTPGLLDAIRSTIHKYADQIADQIIDANESGNVKTMAVDINMEEYMEE